VQDGQDADHGQQRRGGLSIARLQPAEEQREDQCRDEQRFQGAHPGSTTGKVPALDNRR
jgi:hypothetical protein